MLWVLNQLQIPTWQLSTWAAAEEFSTNTCYDWPEAFFPFFKNNTKRKHFSSAVILYVFSLNDMECYPGNVGKKETVLCNSRIQDKKLNKKKKESQKSVPRLLLCLRHQNTTSVRIVLNKNNQNLLLLFSLIILKHGNEQKPHPWCSIVEKVH